MWNMELEMLLHAPSCMEVLIKWKDLKLDAMWNHYHIFTISFHILTLKIITFEDKDIDGFLCTPHILRIKWLKKQLS